MEAAYQEVPLGYRQGSCFALKAHACRISSIYVSVHGLHREDPAITLGEGPVSLEPEDTRRTMGAEVVTHDPFPA